MLSFKPSVKLEKALKKLQNEVLTAASRLDSLSPAEAHYLNRCALISNVGASTRIENALLTDAEVEWVDTTLSVDGRTTAFEQHKAFILDKLSKDRERSVEEVVGCRDVLATVYAQARDFIPLTETVIRGLHHDLLEFYPQASPHAGGYKTSPNCVISKNHATGEVRTVLDPAAPGIATDTAMAELVAWYNANRHESPWPLLVATEFVFRFLAIHPFQDGNGRICFSSCCCSRTTKHSPQSCPTSRSTGASSRAARSTTPCCTTSRKARFRLTRPATTMNRWPGSS